MGANMTNNDSGDSARPVIHQVIDPVTGRQIQVVYACLPPFSSGEISPVHFVRRLAIHWRFISGCAAVFALIGLALSLATPNRFTAYVTALPPLEKPGSGALTQYAGLAAAAGMTLPGASPTSTDSILAISGSRRLAKPLVDKFELGHYYGAKYDEDALAAFSKELSVTIDKKSNLIKLSFNHQNPRVAADVANAAADLLRSIYNEIGHVSATRERIFLENRIAQAESEYRNNLNSLAEFQIKNNAVEIEAQTKATIEAVARLQGDLMVQQVELRSLLASQESDGSPRMKLLRERVIAMEAEISRLQGDGGLNPGIYLGLKGLPGLSIAYLERFRAVKKSEIMVAALSAQLEAARLNEIRSNEVITIVDDARIPERKSGPPRAQICLSALMFGLLAGCGLAILLPIKRQLE